MTAWLIRCYCNESGRDLFDKDYREQDAAVRAKFRAVLNGLVAQPNIEGWKRPNGFDRLSGKYRDLGKLRFKVQNVQHRPLGFFGPTEMTYTLLIWATERDSKYDPPDVRDTALKRMNSVLIEPETKSRACDFL
jgi:hypothetical protein